MRSYPCLWLLLVPLPPLSAQIPVGQAVHGAIGNSSTPLLVVDRALGAAPIGGSGLGNVNAAAIDPIDGSLWLASSTSNGPLLHARLSGPYVITTVAPVASLATATSIAGISFDLDCNPVLASGTVTTTGGIFRVDRASGAVSLLLGGPTAGVTGIANAIERDPLTGDLYFATAGTGGGTVYRLAAPGYAAATPIGAAGAANISGVAFARTPMAPLGTLFLSILGTPPAPTLQTMDVATGLATTLSGTPLLPSLNWVDYDATTQGLWLCSNISRQVFTADTAGNNTVAATLVTGAPAVVEVNAVDVATATLMACPRTVPATPTPLRLELGVAGNPGELAVVAVVAPVVAVLGTGVVDAGGRFALSFPGVVAGAGNPGSVTFLAATVDLATLRVKLSSSVAWPAN